MTKVVDMMWHMTCMLCRKEHIVELYVLAVYLSIYVHCQNFSTMYIYKEFKCTFVTNTSHSHPPLPPPPPPHCHQRPLPGLASLAQLGSSVFYYCSVQQRELVVSGCGQKAPALCSFEAYYSQLMNGEGEGAQGDGP